MVQFLSILASGLAFLFLTTAVSAQPAGPPDPNSDLIRVQYLHSRSLPDAIAFLEIMRLLDAVNKNNSDTAVGFVKQDMSLDQLAAEEFLALMLATFESVKADIQKKKYDLACSVGLPRVAAPRAAATFEAMDNIPEHVAAVTLQQFKVEIGVDKAKRLEQWIESQKEQIVHVKYNRRELHRRRGEDPHALLVGLCAAWATSQTGGAQ